MKLLTLSPQEKDPFKIVAVIRQLVEAMLGKREKLTADRTYYVRTNGNDGNTGLTNDAAGAFLTFDGAYTYIRKNVDFNGSDVTIQLQNTTWTAGCHVSPTDDEFSKTSWVGGGQLIIDGGGGTIHTTSEDCLDIADTVPTLITLQNVTLQTTTDGNCISTLLYGLLNIGTGVTFGPCARFHMEALDYSIISLRSSYSISGGAQIHIAASTGFPWIIMEVPACTITGTPDFPGGFAVAGGTGQVLASTTVYTGSATGPRFACERGSRIQMPSLTFFPGNAAGTVSDGFLPTTDGTNNYSAFTFAQIAKVSLPPATQAGQMIFISDEAGGAVMAFSDGTNWRRVTDRAIVS